MALENWDIYKIRYTIVTAKVPVIALFWMPGCKPCSLAEQILTELVDEYRSEAIFVKCRADEYPADEANEMGLASVPFIVINTYLAGKDDTNKGKIYGAFPSLPTKEKLMEEIDGAIVEMEDHYAERY